MTRPAPPPAPEQLDMVLESLRAGIEIGWSCSSARIAGGVGAVREAAKRDDAFALALEEAEAVGGSLTRPEPEPVKQLPPIRVVAPATADRSGSPLDPERIAWEAAELAEGAYGYLLWLDAKLVAHGFPGMSPWWREEMRAFYASGKRWGVYSVGRGGGKSTTLVRVAVAESLFCPREIPPGQRWIWPFISVSMTDAKRRIFEIKAILAAIWIDVEPKYPSGIPTIELVDLRGNPISFVSIASTIASVSGPSANGATIDEEAKLRDRTTNANPATEILASLLQTFRARAGIRAIRCSSAWTTEGSHAQAIKEGDTLANHIGRVGEAFFAVVFTGLLDVAQWEEVHGDAEAGRVIRKYAAGLTPASPAIPTWLANPTISAIASREEIEALPKESLGGVSRATYWLRENASVPLAPGAVSGATEGMSIAELHAFGERARRWASGHGSPLPDDRPARYHGDPLATRRGYGGDDSL